MYEGLRNIENEEEVGDHESREKIGGIVLESTNNLA